MTKKKTRRCVPRRKETLTTGPPLIDATNIDKQKYTNLNSSITRTFRKDNTILFKSNRYSVPLGTYSPFGKLVSLVVEEPILKIIDHETGEMIGDPAITTAILGRIIHRAEIIQFDGSSYRMKHRTSIFKGETVQN